MNVSPAAKVRMAVIGAGAFGRNHLRVIHEAPDAELVAVVDQEPSRAEAAAAQYGCAALPDVISLAGQIDAAVVAAPTAVHTEIGVELLQMGIDVLIEKPIASDPAQAQILIDAAHQCGRLLQVGHLERFNPAVEALQKAATLPLFFEVHRLNLFSPRSLDVDVVLDLMIHDIDLVLALTGAMPVEVRAAGISILSPKVDIANVRLAFGNGCIANLTASRVSTERVRKLRLFQPRQYLSLDYEKQAVASFAVSPQREIHFEQLPVQRDEPLRRELAHFFDCVRTRRQPLVGGEEARRALEVALQIVDKMEKHSGTVAHTLAQAGHLSGL